MAMQILSKLVLGAAVAAVFGMAYAADEPGQDHPLVGRFEDSSLVAYRESAFDEYYLLTQPAQNHGGMAQNRDLARRLEGRITRLTYQSVPDASTLEVMRAYAESLAANRFEVLFECDDELCGGRDFNHAVVPYDLQFGDNYEDQRYLAAYKSRPDEGDVYVMIYSVNNHHPSQGDRVFTQVDVVEERPRERKTVVVAADEMAQQIAGEGRVALYGIYFDTDSTTIKPESAPTLEQIARLLTDDGELSLLVVGHTDNQGEFDYNIDLSRRRATAVVDALVGDYGVDRGRLTPWGVAFAAPVASNASAEGRARNRRVELVGR